MKIMTEATRKDEAQSLQHPRAEHTEAWALPLWYKRVAVVLATLVSLVVLLITVLVWLWKAPQSGFDLAFPLLIAELLTVSFFWTRGRKFFWRVLTLKYQLLSTKTGLVTGGALLIAALALVLPGLLRRGTPVLDATGHRVAIVGAGAAGIHAAWVLHETGIEFDVYEAADYIGGHAFAPVYEPEVGEPFACDIGFIFGSPTDYQEMKVLMDWYGVERNQSELSVSGHVDGVHWGSGTDITQEALRFQKLAQADYEDPKWNLVPFGVWLSLNGFSKTFREQYVTPLMSVLFITDLGLYQISTRFMLNMAAGRIQWVDFRKGAPAWTVKGGSGQYYDKLSAGFRERIRLQTPVTRVERKDGKVVVEAFGPNGQRSEEWYDDVILAVPADVARNLLVDRDWFEDFVLAQVRYQDSEVVLHTDDSLLPEKKYLRHYNYFKDTEKYGNEFELSGVMNWVHGAGEMSPLPIGSLNPLRPIDPKKVVVRRGWRHHGMDLWHLAMMLEAMPHIQGRGGVWYAGDWVTVIGHGPAMRTGVAAACNAGAKTRVKKPPSDARCIQVRVEDARAGEPAVTERICGKEDVLSYLVERSCSGFSP